MIIIFARIYSEGGGGGGGGDSPNTKGVEMANVTVEHLKSEIQL